LACQGLCGNVERVRLGTSQGRARDGADGACVVARDRRGMACREGLGAKRLRGEGWMGMGMGRFVEMGGYGTSQGIGR
jgi:hypothetical protein